MEIPKTHFGRQLYARVRSLIRSRRPAALGRKETLTAVSGRGRPLWKTLHKGRQGSFKPSVFEGVSLVPSIQIHRSGPFMFASASGSMRAVSLFAGRCTHVDAGKSVDRSGGAIPSRSARFQSCPESLNASAQSEPDIC